MMPLRAQRGAAVDSTRLRTRGSGKRLDLPMLGVERTCGAELRAVGYTDLRDQRSQLFERHGLRVQIPLYFPATQGQQAIALIHGLYAFRDDSLAHRTCHLHDRLRHGTITWHLVAVEL
jgi:hypothetical protein